MNKCAICSCYKIYGAVVIEDIPDSPTEQPSPHPSIEDTEDSSLDSKFQAHKASDGPSVRHEGVVTPIPSPLRLPPTSEWYASTTEWYASTTTTTSSLPSTSYAPSRLEFDAQEPATIPSAQVFSSSSRLPSISEFYPRIETVSAPQSKRKRADGLAGLTAAYVFGGLDKGKRRKA
jgi:hypothetical protein